MSDQKVFDDILANRWKVELTSKEKTLVVKVPSEMVAESVDGKGLPVRWPLYAMASTIRNQYASTDVAPKTFIEDGKMRTSYTFKATSQAKILLNMTVAGKKLSDIIVAVWWFIIEK